MNVVLTLVGALLPFLVSELQQYKVVSPTIGGLITGIEGAVSAFITELTTAPAGSTSSVTATSLLAAIAAAVSVLQTQTTINPTSLLIVTAVDSAIQSGIAASNITAVDPTALKPVTPA